jgi:adenine-specific DNA-methyltransferase
MPTLDWIGKAAVVNHHREVPTRLLHCESDLSFGDPEAGNLLLQGDNLEALKALLPYYAGKVKCIYIDPPYNTGNEGWVYNDNVNSPEIRAWLGNITGKDAEDLSRHDKWLCMMYPRLRLLREFLREDAVVFISCDNNELSNLASLSREALGLRAQVIIPVVNNMKGRNDKANIAQCHEYILMLSNNEFVASPIPLTEAQRKTFKSKDAAGNLFAWRDLRKRGGFDTREERPNLYFPIYRLHDGTLTLEAPIDQLTYDRIVPVKSDGEDGCWRWGKDRVERYLPWLGAAFVKKTGRWNLNYRVYLHPEHDPFGDDEGTEDDEYDDAGEPVERGTKAKSFWWGPEFSTDRAGKHLKEILGRKAFDYPKPVDLIRRVIGMAGGENCLVLDSFAGSGTTAEAVIAANRDDDQRRNFILVEMDPTIAETVTAVRIASVGEGSGFRYCTLGRPLFDEWGGVNEGVTYSDLAAFVFFSDTGSPIPAKATGESSLLGTFQGRAVHLLFAATSIGVANENVGNMLGGVNVEVRRAFRGCWCC